MAEEEESGFLDTASGLVADALDTMTPSGLIKKGVTMVKDLVSDEPPNSKTDKDLQTAAAQAQGSDTPKTEVKGQGEDEDSKISKLFEEQCFVLDALEDFALGNQGITYENFVTLNGTKEDAALLVSKINSRFGKDKNGLSQFMNITPAQYSMLVPKIRLYVQKMQDEKDSFGVIQEIKFRDFTGQNSIDDIMSSAQGRGDGAGLISFSYEFDGRDPGSVSNMIRGELRFLFTDFDTIVKPIR
jgi:hypothetical protein